MVRRVAFAVPGDLATPTGGYAYDARIIAELSQLGWDVDVVDLGDDFPWPHEAARASAEARLSAVAAGETIVIDGLAFGVLPATASLLRDRHPLVALVHHPLAYELGLSPDQITKLMASERAALACARSVVVTSRSTARCLVADYAVPGDRITVIRPGTDRAAPARGSPDGMVRLISVGSVVPRKGYDILVAALAQLTELSWHLLIVGDRGRDPLTAARLDDDIARLQLGDRVTVLGAVARPRLAELYAEADLFVLASRFEGYGMAFSEAIAHGLPVIGTSAGAIAEAVPADAGVLVPPDDVQALAGALRQFIEKPDIRRQFAAAARQQAISLPTWREAAIAFAGVLEAVA